MTAKYNINVGTIHSVGDGNTLHIDSQRVDLDTLISQAMEHIQPNSAMHQAIVALKTDLEATGTPSSATQSLLKRAIHMLPDADKAVGICAKIVDMLDKLGVLGP